MPLMITQYPEIRDEIAWMAMCDYTRWACLPAEDRDRIRRSFRAWKSMCWRPYKKGWVLDRDRLKSLIRSMLGIEPDV